MKTVRSFVGMDVHKATISISIAEDGRSGSIRFLGVIPNTADEVAKLAKRLRSTESSIFAMKRVAADTAFIASSLLWATSAW
jgi:hypothetical protein